MTAIAGPWFCADCHSEVDEHEECFCGRYVVEVRGSENWKLYEARTYDYQEARELVNALRTLTRCSYRLVRRDAL